MFVQNNCRAAYQHHVVPKSKKVRYTSLNKNKKMDRGPTYGLMTTVYRTVIYEPWSHGPFHLLSDELMTRIKYYSIKNPQAYKKLSID